MPEMYYDKFFGTAKGVIYAFDFSTSVKSSIQFLSSIRKKKKKNLYCHEAVEAIKIYVEKKNTKCKKKPSRIASIIGNHALDFEHNGTNKQMSK